MSKLVLSCTTCATVNPMPSSSRPCFAALEPISLGGKGEPVFSRRSVSTSCVRKRGTPYSISRGCLDSNGRDEAFSLARATSSSRFSSMKE